MIIEMTPSTARKLAKALALGRVGLGVAAMANPSGLARFWVGDGAGGAVTQVLGRAVGGRDVALGLGAVLAMRHDRPVRGWLEAGVLADLTDALASSVQFRALPRTTRWAVLAAATTGGGIGAVLARSVDVVADGAPVFESKPYSA